MEFRVAWMLAFTRIWCDFRLARPTYPGSDMSQESFAEVLGDSITLHLSSITVIPVKSKPWPPTIAGFGINIRSGRRDP